MGYYDDIIDLEHYTPKNHPKMSMKQRAAQFAPFAALTGHDALIKEVTRRQEDSYDEFGQIEDSLQENDLLEL